MKRGKNTGLCFDELVPQSDSQTRAFREFDAGQNILMTGPAGSGKTIVAMYLSIREVLRKRLSRLVIVRSAVPSRDIGFMPGGLEEKIALYEIPYVDACAVIFKRDDAYECLKKNGVIQFMTTSFARGVNVRDAALFLDEASNMTFHECDTIMTRAADETRVIVCGDSRQSDLVRSDERAGFDDFCGVLNEMKSFSSIKFSIDDVRRSDIVREYLRARERKLSW